MASFFGKSSKAQEKVERAKVVHPKDYLEGENYDEAGFKFFQVVLTGLEETEAHAEKLVRSIREYCDKYKVDGKDGQKYCDLALYGPFGRRALGAVYGDGNLGGVLYTLAQGFDKIERRERLLAIWSKPEAGSKPERKGGKK